MYTAQGLVIQALNGFNSEGLRVRVWGACIIGVPRVKGSVHHRGTRTKRGGFSCVTGESLGP